MSISPEDIAQMKVIAIASATAGALGAAASILAYLLIPRYRMPLSRILVFSAYTDLMSAVAKAFGTSISDLDEDAPACQWQAAIVTMADTASILWHLIFAIALTRLVMGSSKGACSSRFQRLLIIIGALVPPCLAFSLLLARPEGIHVYGHATLWCWVRDAHPHIQLLILHVPLWIIFCIDLIIFLKIGRHVRRQCRDAPCPDRATNNLRRYTIKASIFLIAFIILWLPNTLNRIASIINSGTPLLVLSYLRASLSPARGLINFALLTLLTLSTPPIHAIPPQKCLDDGLKLNRPWEVDINVSYKPHDLGKDDSDILGASYPPSDLLSHPPLPSHRDSIAGWTEATMIDSPRDSRAI